MERRDVDIFISGGGIAGLIAAATFGSLGLSVVLADPATPPKTADSEGADLRSTAFLEPAQKLLDDIDLHGVLGGHPELPVGVGPLVPIPVVSSEPKTKVSPATA